MRHWTYFLHIEIINIRSMLGLGHIVIHILMPLPVEFVVYN